MSGSPAAFRAYAHRGGAREAPENSLAAFRHATSLGYRHLETDIRPTRDGVAVLHHDARVERTTDGRGSLRDLTWRQVRGVALSDGSAPLRLEELLEEFPDAQVNVDVKEDGSVLALADALRRSGASARVCVTSFSARRLVRTRRLLPPGTESSAHPWEVMAVRALPRLRALPRVHRVQVPVRALGVTFADTAFVHRAHGLGLAVDVWTIDDAAQMQRLLDLGVDGIMTDSPTLLRDVLAQRGHPM